MTLESVVREVGEQFDCEASAQFAPLSNLKVKWRKSSDKIEFIFSDYLEEVPEDSIRWVTTCMLDQIYNHTPIPGDTKTFFPMCFTREFADKHKATWIARNGCTMDNDWIWDIVNIAKEHDPSLEIPEDITLVSCMAKPESMNYTGVMVTVCFRTVAVYNNLVNATKDEKVIIGTIICTKAHLTDADLFEVAEDIYGFEKGQRLARKISKRIMR